MRVCLANAISAFVHVLALGGLAMLAIDDSSVEYQLAAGHAVTLQVSFAAVEESPEPPPPVEMALSERPAMNEPLDTKEKVELERQVAVSANADLIVRTEVAAPQISTEPQVRKSGPPESLPDTAPEYKLLKRRATAEPLVPEVASVPLPFEASVVAGVELPDVPPRLLPWNRPPTYPPELLAAGVEGTVRIRIVIRADGTVKSASLASSSGWKQLDDSALRTVLGYRFAPATRRGVPVDAEYLWPIPFVLRRS